MFRVFPYRCPGQLYILGVFQHPFSTLWSYLLDAAETVTTERTAFTVCDIVPGRIVLTGICKPGVKPDTPMVLGISVCVFGG